MFPFILVVVFAIVVDTLLQLLSKSKLLHSQTKTLANCKRKIYVFLGHTFYSIFHTRQFIYDQTHVHRSAIAEKPVHGWGSNPGPLRQHRLAKW